MLPRSSRSRAALLICLACTFSAPSIALAQDGAKTELSAKDKAKANARFNRARKWMEKGKVDRAGAEFEQLYKKYGMTEALFFRAKALEETGDAPGAFGAYEKYAKATEGPNEGEHTKEALGAMQELSAQVSRLKIEAKDGSTLIVDSVEVGEAPLDHVVYVKPGEHEISAQNEEGEDIETKKVTVAAESTEKVRLGLPPEPEEAPKPKPVVAAKKSEAPKPKAPPSKPVDYRPIVGFSIAGALAVGAGVFGVMAAGSASDFKDRKNTLAAPKDDLEHLQNKTRTQFYVASGLGVAALGVAGYTLFKWVIKPKSVTKEQSRVGLMLPDQAHIGPTGASLQWGF